MFTRLGSSSKVSFIISKVVEFLLLTTDLKFKKFSLSYLSLDFTYDYLLSITSGFRVLP